MRFRGTIRGYYVNETEYVAILKQDRESLEIEKKKAIITKELDEVRIQFHEAQKEKKDYDSKMQQACNMKCSGVINKIDNYKTQINKLMLALNICQKSLINSKQSAMREYKQSNPFNSTELKRLVNKIYTLTNKLYKL